MIRYALNCQKGHEFEAWFRSSDDYDKQLSGNIILCPACGSDKIEKAIMAPNVRKKSITSRAPEVTPTEAPEQKHTLRPASVPDTSPSNMPPNMPPDMPTEMHGLNLPDPKQIVDAMRQYRKQVMENADNVGDDFADEARKIHYDEAPDRGIYGNATPGEVADLTEEGIDIAPLPVLPEDNN